MSTTEKTLKFKTNLKCGGCVSTVAPFLNEANGIEKWEADTTHADKLLTVVSNGISEEEVMGKVQEAGFKIEPL